MPRDLWKSAGENGLLGVTMPEAYGGAEADKLCAAITWEEQARYKKFRCFSLLIKLSSSFAELHWMHRARLRPSF